MKTKKLLSLTFLVIFTLLLFSSCAEVQNVEACRIGHTYGFSGMTVVLFERGEWHDYDEHPNDELISQRTEVLGSPFGPDHIKNPRVVTYKGGSKQIVTPIKGGYSNNAACVGSGTVSYGAMAWRFMEEDFPVAIQTGNCDLRTGCKVVEIMIDDHGKATGVKYFDKDDKPQIQTADLVVVAGAAIETARLLLNSKSKLFPIGAGNNYDWVGRNLQGHAYTGAYGLFDYDILDFAGPGATIAWCDFNHYNPGIYSFGKEEKTS
ncbi:MAG: GMC family oxidoreductase N-terminal domain-containing protein [Bacteroidota bacterium]|nr:GMC family oxidoreductase N-terminal domain-containing protein [Bacteroidota bacterium]